MFELGDDFWSEACANITDENIKTSIAIFFIPTS